VKEVEEGGFLDEAAERHFSTLPLSDQQKAIIYEMSSGVIRQKVYFDWLLSYFVKKEMKLEVRHLLWVALFQVLFMKKAFYHVVNETVDFAKKYHGKPVANFVNAVLRRALADKDRVPMPEDALDRMSVDYSFPRWLITRWADRFGLEDTRSLLAKLNTEPEFCLRIDISRISRQEVLEYLKERGVESRAGSLLPNALYVNRLGPVLKDRLFKDGVVRVQDESSQAVAYAVAPMPDMLILDAAAEPGTKTEHLIQLCPSSRIVAMDLHVKKIRSLAPRAFLVRGDAVRNTFKKGGFDSILLDAPCSSLGVIRKHPEIKWRRREGDIPMFAAYQVRMIEALWESLKPGGHFIYSVCSFEPEETFHVIEKLKEHIGFSLEEPVPFSSSAKGFHLSLPHVSGSDGFFLAKLKKEP
jgi:16S rRNA (cytosine967-C5)-methyltransferase